MERIWLIIKREKIESSNFLCFIFVVSNINGNELRNIIYVYMVIISLIIVVFILKFRVIFESRVIGINFVVLKINVESENVKICINVSF